MTDQLKRCEACIAIANKHNGCNPFNCPCECHKPSWQDRLNWELRTS